MKAELRAMTKRLEILERSPVSTSVRPSLKYSWSGSLLMLTKGRTTIEGLSGSGNVPALSAETPTGAAGGRKRYLRTPPAIPTSSTNTPASAARHLYVGYFLSAGRASGG